MKKVVFAFAAMALIAGCQTAPTAPTPPPVPAAPQPGAAGATKVGAGSKAGFCTYKDPSGALYEAKCK